VDDVGLPSFGKGFKRLQFLVEMSLTFDESDYITDLGLQNLRTNLVGLSSLKEIYLSFSRRKEATNDGLLSLSEAQEKLTSLEVISLRLYYLSDFERTKAKEMLRKLPVLREIDVLHQGVD